MSKAKWQFQQARLNKYLVARSLSFSLLYINVVYMLPTKSFFIHLVGYQPMYLIYSNLATDKASWVFLASFIRHFAEVGLSLWL